MEFKYRSQLFYIKTKNPNIIVLPNKKLLVYAGQLESYPPILIKGSIFLGLFKLLTFQGGISFAELA